MLPVMMEIICCYIFVLIFSGASKYTLKSFNKILLPPCAACSQVVGKINQELALFDLVLFFRFASSTSMLTKFNKLDQVFNSKTGETVTYNLDKPRLVPGAIPTQMPNCPDYFSAPTPPVRKSRDEKLEEKENHELAAAIQKIKKELDQQQKLNDCHNLQDIKNKLNLAEPWKLLDNGTNITFCTLDSSDDKGPNITKAIIIDKNMVLNSYINTERLPSIDKYRFPLKTTSISEIRNISKTLVSLNSNLTTDKIDVDFTIRLNLILALLFPLKNDSFKFCTVIKFIYE